MFKHKKLLLVLTIVILAFVSWQCAPGNYRWNQEMSPGHKAGFFAGIWHGLIIIITFVISLFNHKVGIYEINNAGWPYNLGFIIGLCFSILAPWRLKSHKRHQDHKSE